jgi:hypothetical protein
MINMELLAATCRNKFFGIEGWYKYLPGSCKDLDFDKYGLGSLWLVIAGITDALLRIAAVVSIVFFIFGAFKMVTSQGSPEGVKSARGTMTNALIGLVVCVVSAWFIGFIIGTVFKIS